MIKGTNTNCKITKISINGNTATISMLFFASEATVPAKSFRIYLKDTDSNQLINVDNNVYWVDQVNNYNNDSNNIDIKKHKEIMFSIDISRNNTASISSNHWIRDCYILLIDTEKDISLAPSWSSDKLNLISADFEIPTIKNISFDTINITSQYQAEQIITLSDIFSQFDFEQKVLEYGTIYKFNSSLAEYEPVPNYEGDITYFAKITELQQRGNIKVKFNLEYDAEKDFNYNNKNFTAYLNVRSVATEKLLESKEIPSSSVGQYNEIETTNKYKLKDKIVIELIIANKNNEILTKESKIYKPAKKLTNTFIKTSEGIKRVIAFHVATDTSKEHEGEWL